MYRKFLAPVVAVAVVAVAGGCGDDKPVSPKAPPGTEMKGLPTPGSPGGGKAPGGKVAAD